MKNAPSVEELKKAGNEELNKILETKTDDKTETKTETENKKEEKAPVGMQKIRDEVKTARAALAVATQARNATQAYKDYQTSYNATKDKDERNELRKAFNKTDEGKAYNIANNNLTASLKQGIDKYLGDEKSDGYADRLAKLHKATNRDLRTPPKELTQKDGEKDEDFTARKAKAQKIISERKKAEKPEDKKARMTRRSDNQRALKFASPKPSGRGY